MIETQKTDDPSFVRDKRSRAILNIDKASYTQFRAERERSLQLKKLTEEVDTLRSDVQQIKQLLKRLIKTDE